MGKKGPLWWRESDWLLRGSSAANQILLRHSGPILSIVYIHTCFSLHYFGCYYALKVCKKSLKKVHNPFFNLKVIATVEAITGMNAPT